MVNRKDKEHQVLTKQWIYLSLLVLCGFGHMNLEFNSSTEHKAINDAKLTSRNATLTPVTGHNKRFLLCNSRGRYGNLMFQIASMFCVAQQSKRLFVVRASHKLCKVLPKLSSYAVADEKYRKLASKSEKFNCIEKSGICIPKLVQMSRNSKATSFMPRGYFQTWKYFDHCESVIRNLFISFDQEIKHEINHVSRQLFKIARERYNSSLLTSIHIRRGDFLRKQIEGFTVSSISYLLKATKIMKSFYPSTVFVVFSDDLRWCKKNVIPLRNDTFLFDYEGIMKAGRLTNNHKQQGFVELMVRGRCNHSIVTSGTYSWWGAWLANGTTIYDKSYPGNGLDRIVNRTDYYPPQWIPL